MKKSDLKQILNDSYESKIPDITSKIDLSLISIEDAPKRSFMRLGIKPIMTLVTMTMLIIMVSVGVLSINQDGEVSTPITLTSSDSVSFTAVSSTVLLDAIDIQAQLSNQTLMYAFSSRKNDVMITDKLDKLNPYFNMIELFSEDNGLKFGEPTTSDLEGYAFKMTYQTTDMSGVIQHYTYYYNEIEISIDEKQTDGIIQMGLNTYYLESIIKVDDEQTDVETISYLDQASKTLNYIKSISQTQNDQQSFEYEVYQSGNKIEQTKLELEHVGQHVKIKLEYEHEITKEKMNLEVKRGTKNGQTLLDVKYDLESNDYEEKGKMFVYVSYDTVQNTSQYRYEIESNKGGKSEYIGSRNHHDDEHHNHDDDEQDDDHEDD